MSAFLATLAVATLACADAAGGPHPFDLSEPDNDLPAPPDAGREPPSGAPGRPARITCRYPGCERPAAAPGPVGRPPKYCDDPQHNRVSAHRARRRLDDPPTTSTATIGVAEPLREPGARPISATDTSDAAPDVGVVDWSVEDAARREAQLLTRAERAEALASERARILTDSQRRDDERLTRVLGELASAHADIAALHAEIARLASPPARHPPSSSEAGSPPPE